MLPLKWAASADCTAHKAFVEEFSREHLKKKPHITHAAILCVYLRHSRRFPALALLSISGGTAVIKSNCAETLIALADVYCTGVIFQIHKHEALCSF